MEADGGGASAGATAIPRPIAGVVAIVEAARVAALGRLLGCGGAMPSPPTPSQKQQQDHDLESRLGGGESSGTSTLDHESKVFSLNFFFFY